MALSPGTQCEDTGYLLEDVAGRNDQESDAGVTILLGGYRQIIGSHE